MIESLVRAIAVLALINSLGDGGRLLGVGSSGVNPLELFGVTGFVILGGFAIARLFASVGMWIQSTWGTPLLFGATLIELAIFLAGSIRLDVGIVGFGMRLIQLAGALLILWSAFRLWRQGIHD